MNTKLTLTALAALAGFAASANAQVSISSLNTTYSENFDGLASSPDSTAFTFVDNTTLTGWTVNSEEMDSNSDEYFTRDGSSNSGEVYSFGAVDAGDRALGYVGSGGNDFFNAALTLTNDTGSVIDEIVVNYVGEQWRSGGDTSDNNNSLVFSYQTSASVSIPASSNQTGWTAVNALDFVPPQASVAAGALDGNSASNRTVFSNISITGLSWAAGEDLVLRWFGGDGSGSDAGLAIDDFSVTAVPEPSAFALLAGMFGLVFVMLKRRQA